MNPITRQTFTGLGILAMAALLPATAIADGPRPYYDYAEVLDYQPIVRRVRIEEPVQRCWDEQVVHQSRGRDRAPRSTAGDTIVGGLLGGLVGRQFGDGKGKDAATIAGVLVGSSIARDRSERYDYYKSQARGSGQRYVTYETRCATDVEYREEERVDGYRVTYLYDGETYTTRTERRPGEQIRVQVSVRPVD